ncbi:hypothetical protein E1B00_09815 [Arenimonas terrae]|uniref:Uncharacterized protein n=1 Tax=Arenimonas terrae TaxID=2546226 RepID=A0A5C4RS16_9GAMM|nr:hypothetical protein E1B00_09815 [Arenimonas terrae]
MPAWGALAGLMLMAQGPTLLLSRWSPATVALVHVFTLGVLGNAMVGSLLQFLPAAAGVRLRGGPRLPWVLHALLNAGTVALVAGFQLPSATGRTAGAVLLGATFLVLAAASLPELLARARCSLLHAGIVLSLLAALATVALGCLLVAAIAGRVALSIPRWTNLHAAVGVLGWVLGLVAAVGRVVMPMFQGAPEVPARLQAGWLAALALGLTVAGVLAAGTGVDLPLRVLASAAALSLAGGGLWLQSRSRKSAPGELARFWRFGFLALAAAGALLLVPGEHSLLVGVLGLGVGLPMLVLGMLLEIAAFLGWIALHRRCGRGLQLPGVQVLLPASRRRIVRRCFALAGLALVAAALWPPAFARLAGALLLAANLSLAWALAGVGRGVREFTAAHPAR